MSGVVITGPPGSGKSRLAAEALAGLGPGFTVVRVVAAEAARAVPFGAFAPVLPTEEGLHADAAKTERRGAETGGLLGWAAESIVRAAGDQRLILSVDDAQLLDPASAALVRQLTRSGRCFTVLTTTGGEEAVDGSVAVIALEPLPVTAVREVVETVLEGVVSEAVVTRMYALSGGNPLHLRELITAGRETGWPIRRAGAGWEIAPDRDADPALTELIAERLERLDAPVGGVLELLAFGEPVGVGVLAALAEPEALAAAGERGLAELMDNGRRTYVRLAHGLYGRVIRAATPPERAAQRRRRLADAVQAMGARRREDPLRMAVWRLDGDAPGPPGPLVTACRLAWAAHDYPLAIRLGEAAVAAGGGVAAAVALANVLMNVNRHEEGEAVLAAVWERALDERERVLLTSVRSGLMFAMDRVADAGRLLEETERALRDPGLRAELRVTRGNLVTLAGQCRSGRAIMEELLSEPELAPVVVAQARTFRALALAHSGRGQEALAEAEAVAANAPAWRDEVPFLDPILALTRFSACFFMGDLAAAERVVSDVRGRGDLDGWPPAAIIFRAAEASLARLQGRLEDAWRIAGPPEAVADPDGRRLLMPCLAERAHTAALTGDLVAARAALVEAGRHPAVFFGLLRHGMDLARAWVVARSGEEPRRAVELALLAAARARSESLYGLELVALHDVVRLGAAAEVAGRLAELEALVDGDLAGVFAANAAAQATCDGTALAAVARSFEDLGLSLYAAEATARAETLTPAH